MNERGSMSVFTVLFSVAVLLLAGLLVDGGAAMNARLQAADIAEQAARAAADTIDVDFLRQTGEVRIQSGDAACARARDILAAQGNGSATLTSCAVAGDGQHATTGVEIRWKAFFLTIIGFGGGTMAARATAGPRTGQG